jgi:nitroreductase
VDVVTAIRERRATRAFTSEGVDRATVERLLGIAVQAPSAMNDQPWAFVVFDGVERLKSFSDDAKKVLLAAGQLDFSPQIRTMLTDAAFSIFYGAPVLIVICATSAQTQAAEDCCLAAQTLMLAAHDAGLASCPIGFARPWLNLPETKRHLGIPETYHPVFPLILGHGARVEQSHGRRAPTIVWPDPSHSR